MRTARALLTACIVAALVLPTSAAYGTLTVGPADATVYVTPRYGVWQESNWRPGLQTDYGEDEEGNYWWPDTILTPDVAATCFHDPDAILNVCAEPAGSQGVEAPVPHPIYGPPQRTCVIQGVCHEYAPPTGGVWWSSTWLGEVPVVALQVEVLGVVVWGHAE